MDQDKRQAQPAIRVEVVDWEYARILAQKTPSERLQAANDMHASAFATICRIVHRQHPEYADEKHLHEVLRRFIGEDAIRHFASCG